jgi:soluble lytic murein transglycosylase-like protein
MNRRAEIERTQATSRHLPRRQGWLLVALAAVLAADGTVPPPPAATVPGEAAAIERAQDEAPEQALARALQRMNPTLSPAQGIQIGEAVLRYSAKYRLDPELVTAVLVVESGARPWAVSPKGARGLMQVMPYMLRPMGMVGNLSTIETNVEAGCIILADNIRRLGEEDGISAYFWGSEIRGDGYLARVQAARARLRDATSS